MGRREVARPGSTTLVGGRRRGKRETGIEGEEERKKEEGEGEEKRKEE